MKVRLGPEGQLPDDVLTSLAGAAADVLVLEVTGPAAWSDVGHAIARLRRAGAVRPESPVVLRGQERRPGPAERLRAALPHWGARIGGEGDRLDVDAGPLPRHRPVRTLLLGGASSGKSDLAELLLAADPSVHYLATGPRPDPASDADWAARVDRHRQRRPSWWTTIEPDDLPVELTGDGPVLLDSVGSWLTGVLDRVGAWDSAPGWPQRLAEQTDALVGAWRARRAPLVAVSDETGLGVVPATPAGRLFRDELGRLNRRLADESESVALVVAGRLLTSG